MGLTIHVLWAGIWILTGIAIIAVVGRGLALATDGLSFEALYPFLPAIIVEDARGFDRWFATYPLLTWVHISTGGLFLTLAPFQLSSSLRRRHLRLHRWSGRVVLLAAGPTGISGLMLTARSPHEGIAGHSAIAVFGTLFLLSALLAYRAIRRGNVPSHREWMLRMFSIGLGIATVRIVGLPVVLFTGRRPSEVIGASFWLGLTLTFLAAEYWIRVTRKRRPGASSLAA